MNDPYYISYQHEGNENKIQKKYLLHAKIQCLMPACLYWKTPDLYNFFHTMHDGDALFKYFFEIQKTIFCCVSLYKSLDS